MIAPGRFDVVAELGAAGPYALALSAAAEVVTTLVHTGEVAVLTDDGIVRIEVGEQPGQVVADDRGGAWCAVTGSEELVRVDRTPAGLAVGRRVALPGGPYGLASHAEGLSVSLLSTHELGRVSWSGEVTRTRLPAGSFPAMVTVDRHDQVWVALNQAAALARVNAGRADVVPLPAGAAPVGLAAGSDGLWVADLGGSRILRVREGAEADSWALEAGSRPHAVVTDPDGGCWFTEWGANRLGRIDLTGALTEYDLSAHGDEPHGLLRTGAGLVVAMESGAVVRLSEGVTTPA